MNSSQAFQKPEYKPTSTPCNSLPTNDWLLKADQYRQGGPYRGSYVTFEPNTNRQGQDYHVIRTSSASDCQSTCAGESLCRAFTFVPYSSRPGGNCWLKDKVPQQTSVEGWTSGVKQ